MDDIWSWDVDVSFAVSCLRPSADRNRIPCRRFLNDCVPVAQFRTMVHLLDANTRWLQRVRTVTQGEIQEGEIDSLAPVEVELDGTRVRLIGPY